MLDVASLKQRMASAIDSRAEELVRLSKDILVHPEPGYRETRTAGLVADWFQSSGLRPRTGIALTGVVATLDTGRPGPHVAVFGELDSLIVPGHAHADPGTGAAHACGHHTQIGNMLGVAAGLLDPSVTSGLCGKVSFMAVPAEEGIEIEFRLSLRDAGKIEFLNGKPEFVRLGVMDDVDIAMMMHTSAFESGGFGLYRTNANLKKFIEFIGKAAHAGSRPDEGINALNAATLALSAIHFQRETFRDADSVRVHPIITRGGASASSVPADVRMETFVRASNVEALRDANEKVDRAVRAGALAVGASVRISTMPGPLPSNWDVELERLWTANAESLAGAGSVRPTRPLGWSTDMADISHLMPAIHPFSYSAAGAGHGVDYVIKDYPLAILASAKAMGMTVIDLLAEGGVTGRTVVDSFRATYTRQDYLRVLRALASERTYAPASP